MNAATRQHLRAAIDAHKRSSIAVAHGARYCIGCGTNTDDRTRGCQPCNERHAMRRRRGKGDKR